MKSKNRVLIFMTSIIGLIIATVCTVSMADTDKYLGSHEDGLNYVKKYGAKAVGCSVDAACIDLITRDDLYCIQHDASLKGEEVTFKVEKYISIDGNTATNNEGKSITSIENGKLAYILNQNEGYGKVIGDYTKTQRALYGVTTSWSNAVGIGLGADISYEKNDDSSLQNDNSKTLLKEAEEYAKNIGNGKGAQKATDNTDKNSIKVTTYTEDDVNYIRVGPFNWTFDGKIEKLKVYGDNNKEISNVKFSKFKGNDETFFESKEIKSNQNFYITIRADSGFTKIGKINATTKITNGSTIYTAKIWFLTVTGMQNLLLADTDSRKEDDSVETPFDYDITFTKDLTIEKVDKEDVHIKLAGVGFIIQNKETKKYVCKQKGKITYVDSKENATEFITDKNGKIQIDGLIIGTYLAYETKNPNDGYKKIDGSIEIAASTTKKIIPNEKEYVKLSGYVWKDNPSAKNNKRNNLYKTNSPSGYEDSQDNKDNEITNGITVRLKDNDGNIIQETTTGEKGLYSEIDGGEYIFKNVLIKELANYYIEFEYDGLIWQSVELNLNKDSGSKATDVKERDKLDKDFASVNSTGENRVNVKDKESKDKYSITYNDTVNHVTSIKDSSACTLHANTKDAKYYLNKLYSKGTTEIKYINLGLYERPQADLSLKEELENVNVGVNGYWHIYNYPLATIDNSEFDIDNQNTWNVGVKFKNRYTGTYKRAIYQADLEYTNEDKSKELQVYLTYRVSLTNESAYLTKVNNIVDYLDNRYTLTKVGTGLDEQKNITGNISFENPQKYNDEYQKTIINVNTTIKPGETNYIYVQFKLDRSAVLEILNNNETLSNRAEINSYTVYKDNEGNTVAAVDNDSVPGNTKIENLETYEDDIDSEPPVQLEVKNSRKISGTVFVDSTSGELLTGQIRQGDGIFDEERETTVKGVNVTLHEINNSISDMTTTTDEKGNYEFSGYIPGQYTITYTWGDKTYTVQNYKGTVYDLSRNQGDMYWYKDQVDTRKTDAIDNYETRKAIDKEMAAITNNTINDQIADAYSNGNNHPDVTKTTMDSTTPTMEFRVEYDDNDIESISDGINAVIFEVKNVDFGIVERARQQLDLIKRVSSFKITLANGQLLVDATVDENGNLQGIHNYVTYMGPSVSNGYSNKGFIKAEIDNELIQGATLEVGYEIKFINNSELDYMSENYYKYGIFNKEDKVVTLTPSAVVDYLDKNLGFEQEKNTDWKQITVEELGNLHAVKVGDTEFLNSRMILYTEKTATPLQPKQTVAVGLNVSKLLTTSSDLAFNNDAETVTIKKPETPEEHKGSVIKYFPIDDAEEVEITPSTGEDRNYVLPIVVGIVAIVVLGTGVFVIKRFLINNK